MFDLATATSYIFNSNRLDGITLGEEQTRSILATPGIDPNQGIAGDGGREFEAEVVLGHRRALEYLTQLAGSGAPIDERAVQGLHKALMGELLLSAGEYRECTLRYKGLLIASPPEHLTERMAWLANLIRTGLERAPDAHKLSWRIHHEFITLHPFIEGNGRVARLLLNAIRLRKGLGLAIVRFDEREQYSRAILEFQQQKIRRAQDKATP